MTLTRTLTQTHRHFVAEMNLVSVENARYHGWPLVALCGEVWIPGQEGEVVALPMCGPCDVRHGKGARRYGVPQATYVYRCYDAVGHLLYVGCTTDPKTRLDAHRKNAWWWAQSSRTRLIVFGDREYALHKESEAITSERPLWNVRGQDYASFTLHELRERAAHAAMVGAPVKYQKRFEREALKNHGATLAREAVS